MMLSKAPGSVVVGPFLQPQPHSHKPQHEQVSSRLRQNCFGAGQTAQARHASDAAEAGSRIRALAYSLINDN